MESRYGRAQRIWALDRGMVSEDNLDFLKAGQRQYIVGTPKSQLKRFEQQLAAQDWHAIREGLEVKLCPCPDGGNETYILCRSRDRREKEQAMHARFEKRIEEGLTKIAAGCVKRAQPVGPIERRVGRLLGQNTRAAGLFDVQIQADANGAAQVTWKKVEKWRAWAQLSEGSYVLRSNVTGWSDEDSVAGVHPIDRRGDGVPHSEERFVATSGVASERKTACWPTFWSASWPSCCGSSWANSARRPAWETNRGACWTN